MKQIRKDLFNMFKEYNEYELYEKLCNYIDKYSFETKGKENAKFYDILDVLLCSINNSGCEDRRSEQISFINKEQFNISDIYEDFLP